MTNERYAPQDALIRDLRAEVRKTMAGRLFLDDVPQPTDHDIERVRRKITAAIDTYGTDMLDDVLPRLDRIEQRLREAEDRQTHAYRRVRDLQAVRDTLKAELRKAEEQRDAALSVKSDHQCYQGGTWVSCSCQRGKTHGAGVEPPAPKAGCTCGTTESWHDVLCETS